MSQSRESLHETTLHGKKTFPFALYHARIPEWLRGFPPHWHDEFEIIIVIDGSGLFTVNGRQYLCKKDDLILIPGGHIHGIAQNGTETCEYFNILFSFSLLEENPESHCTRQFFSVLMNNAILNDYYLPQGSHLNNELLPLAKDLVEHRKEKYSGYELMIKSRLFNILHLVIKEDIKETKGKKLSENDRTNTERIKKILSYTAEHFTERISIQQASEICAISQSRFMNIFRDQTGMSFIQYLNDYRLEVAAEQLSTGNESVTEIAIKNGFDNISYFIRAFKAKFGCTPLEYKKR